MKRIWKELDGEHFFFFLFLNFLFTISIKLETKYLMQMPIKRAFLIYFGFEY